MSDISDENLEMLRAIVGDDASIPESTLRALLLRSGGDVAAAANSFFDGGVASLVSTPSIIPHSSNPPPVSASVGDDVLGTLFKTLEDQGRKLAERDQQLDMATRVCEALVRRLRETERTLATVDADRSEREPADVEVQTDTDLTGGATASTTPYGAAALTVAGSNSSLAMLHQRLPLLRLAASRLLLPLGMIRWLGGLLGAPALILTQRLAGIGAVDASGRARIAEGESDARADPEPASAGAHVGQQAAEAEQVAAAVAAAQAALQEVLDLPKDLLDQVAEWEKQQSSAEGDWRLKQSRMHLEFEERKRRLQEQQLGQRKKLRESCDAALRPLYAEGVSVCAELEQRLAGKLCRLCEHAPRAGVPQEMLPGPLARIRSISFGQLDQPLRAPNCPPRSVGAVPVSSGVIVTLEKISDRNGIAMLPVADDPLAGFTRSSRGQTEVKIPLRLLGTKARVLTAEEAEAAMRPADERVFVVRYAGGEHGGPIEPVQILPEGLSLAEYDISFAAGAAALRVEHRHDGPVRCRAEPAAQKQVFADTPVELYTQEVDPETHNIVQVYFSDLRDEVAVDVLNLTGTSTSLEDAECCSFPPDATGAALNYKIIVRDGAVIAVLYQEGDDVRASPFVEHRLPSAGAFVTLPDGSLGKLGPLPRGLIVAREPRDLPEHVPQWPSRPGLRHKGKHPAELPGMVDLQVVQQNGAVLWPHQECSVPVCALTAADSSRLREWHATWDSYVSKRAEAADQLASEIEELLASGSKPSGGAGGSAEGGGAGGGMSAKEILSKLTETYGRLEEQQRELNELEAPCLEGGRVERLQKGISRFAALARFG